MTAIDVLPEIHVDIVDVEDHEHGALLRLSGEVDLATAPRLVTAFNELAERQPTEVIVDASLVTFMDGAGLHALTHGEARIHEVGARIALITSRQVGRLLEFIFPEPLFAARVDTMEQAQIALGWAQEHLLLSSATDQQRATPRLRDPLTRPADQPG